MKLALLFTITVLAVGITMAKSSHGIPRPCPLIYNPVCVKNPRTGKLYQFANSCFMENCKESSGVQLEPYGDPGSRCNAPVMNQCPWGNTGSGSQQDSSSSSSDSVSNHGSDSSSSDSSSSDSD